jgi:hypothetical protein
MRDATEEKAMAYRTMVAAVAVACLMSRALAPQAAAQEAAAPTIIPAETLKWKPTPFADVTAALVAGNPTGSGMYVILVKSRAGGVSAPTLIQISVLSQWFRVRITQERARILMSPN